MTNRQPDGDRPGLPSFAALVVATFAAAASGAVASLDAATFYLSLDRAPWAPSARLFGPVWTVLYVSMAVAACLVVRAVGWRAARVPMVLYGVQLVVNALWTWLFFAWRQGELALLDVGMLVALVAATAWQFWRVRPLAGALILPYLAWVSFATVLTWSVWSRNPGAL